MLALESVRIVRYLRTLRGGSQPMLVQASDGFLYVVKFNNNLQGPHLAFNESAGSELFRACGLAVPAWKPLLLTNEMIDRTPGCWMQTVEGVQRPEAGMCFGSRYLGHSGARILEILPGTSFSRIRNRASFWMARLIDVCGEHADNRQAIFVEQATGWLNAFFLDHGHMFGGPSGGIEPRLQTSCYLDSRVYSDISSNDSEGILRIVRELNADDLWLRIHALPDDWKARSALQGFERCLNRLSNYNMLRNVMDALVDTHRRRTPISRSRIADAHEGAPALLHARLPARGRRARIGWEDYPAAG